MIAFQGCQFKGGEGIREIRMWKEVGEIRGIRVRDNQCNVGDLRSQCYKGKTRVTRVAIVLLVP
jgi:hypothetical protein